MALLNIRKSLDLIRLRQCVVGSADIVLYISKCVVIMLRFGENNLQFVVTEACRLTIKYFYMFSYAFLYYNIVTSTYI